MAIPGAKRGRGRPSKTAITLDTGETQAGSKVQIAWNPGEANEKQKRFFASRTLYTAYGGARGGGKTWAVRVKAYGGALHYPGIRILILRSTYRELEENHIRPMLKMANPEITTYNAQKYTLFVHCGNGAVSEIRFGHWSGVDSEREYQGIEYDWIFMDEATQFSEQTFRYLCGCLRGVNDIPKRFYLTCNPGGPGHRWVKRLFIDRDFKTNEPNPLDNENPDDYSFIPATLEDNTALINSPGGKGYAAMFAGLSEQMRRAYRDGDWDILAGNYFPEFALATHTVKPFRIPDNWLRYRAIDYGLDALACLWVAVDEEGRAWVYREFKQSGLIVQEAARGILERTLPGERIEVTYAPPDLWSRQKDTGRTMAELFAANGVPLVKADNSRVTGHMMIKDGFAVREDGKPGLVLFTTCQSLINDIRDIQADDKDPNDCAKNPHDITHDVDALRYFCISRQRKAERGETAASYDDDDLKEQDYHTFMVGGSPTNSYMSF